MAIRAFDVFLNGRKIDTIFYKMKTVTEAEVRDSLVNHDCYDSRIVVRERDAARRRET